MKLRFLFLLVFLGNMIAHAQLNVHLISNLDYDPILNDIWGYVDHDSTEYALVGLQTGLSIVSLADPSNPEEVQFIPGANSTWRDMKTFGDFAYLVADQGSDGLLIIDLSSFPEDTATYAFWKPDIPGLGVLRRSHNIWIDEYGLAYLAGSNIGGTIILDIHTDPWNPTYLAKMPLDYAHDIYARDSIVYASEIYVGELRIYDISDLSNIKLLGSTPTPYTFTHNAWLSDDGKTCFTTDERANAYVGAYDVSDPANIKELDRFRPAATEGRNVIPHNVHVWNDYLIISYYTDGCIIVDASRPGNLIEVGNFDTYPEEDGGYNGSWGAYPFLPSGNILMSDRQHGLFVLGPTYVRGCFLEGTVRDQETHLPVVNAQIEILLDSTDHSEVLKPQRSDAQGSFKTGKAVPGSFMIRVTHPDYLEKVVEGTFENGQVLELNIELEPKPKFAVGGRVVDAVSKEVVPFAYVALQSDDRLYQTTADDQGAYMFPAIIKDDYRLYAGNWGQFTIYQQNVFEELNEDIEIKRGYYDDFLNDFGWTVTGTSTVAHWERAIPISELLFSTYDCNPENDLTDDFGEYAYVTGNAGGDAGNDGVEMGYSMLSSPMMDLTTFNAPVVSYSPWLCERLIEEEVYYVLLSNGTDTVAIDTITTNALGGWWQATREHEISGLLLLTNQMQIHFLAQNILDTDNTVKAGIDRVVVYDALPSSTRSASLGELTVYPNPSHSIVHVEISKDILEADAIHICDIFGKCIYGEIVNSNSEDIDVSWMEPGVYIMQMLKEGKAVAVGKVVVE